MRRWRDSNMCDGMYPVRLVEEYEGLKSVEKRRNIDSGNQGYGDSESEDAVLEEILNRRPPPYQPSPLRTTPNAPMIEEKVNKTPEQPSNFRDFPERVETRYVPSTPIGEARITGTPVQSNDLHRIALSPERQNNEQPSMSEYERSAHELVQNLSRNMKAVTVPVTIGPVIPVFDDQKIREPRLTIPLQQSLKRAIESTYPDLSDIRQNTSVNPPELTFNKNLTCAFPTGAESDSATPERSTDKINLTQTPRDPTDRELSEWIKTLKLKEQESKVLDVAKLKVDMEELIIGTIGTDRLQNYQDDELIVCKNKIIAENL
ncbi:uncharacterized protein LOC144782762 [Lissotriton helveticus]